MDKKPSNPRSNKPKASHHGSELFALGSKPGSTSKAPASSNADRKRETAAGLSGIVKKPKLGSKLDPSTSASSSTSSIFLSTSDSSQRSSSQEYWEQICIESEPADLVNSVLTAMEQQDSDRLIGLICGAIKLVVTNRTKLDNVLMLSLTYLAKMRPHLFCNEVITSALLAVFRRESQSAFKGRPNNIACYVLATNLLMCGYRDKSSWPESFVKLYIDDATNDRVWVDNEDCSVFVENICTAFGTRVPPKHLLIPETAPTPPNVPTTTTTTSSSSASSSKDLLMDEESSESHSSEMLKLMDFGRKENQVPRFAHITATVEKLVLEAVKEHLNRRQAPDCSTRSLLKFLSVTSGICDVRALAITRLELWIHNQKLMKHAQELLTYICCNITGTTVRDHEVLSNLVKMRLKTKPVMTVYLSTVKEMINSQPDILFILLKFVVQNELSNARNPNNMGMLTNMFQTAPNASAECLAEIYKEFLLQREDCIRTLRVFLRELVKILRYDMNLVKFCRALTNMRPEYITHIQGFEFRERVLQSLVDLICMSMFLSVSPQVKEATNTLRSSGDLKINPVLAAFYTNMATVQLNALSWMQEVVAQNFKPNPNEYAQLLNKLLFLETPESYTRHDQWPPEPERGQLLRIVSEIPVHQDSILCIIYIGMTKEIPFPVPDACEIVEQVVKRAAAFRFVDFPTLLVDKISIIEYLFSMAEYHYPEKIALPAGYEPPKLAISILYWKAWNILLMLSAHNPSTIGSFCWERYPMLRNWMEFCITNQFQENKAISEEEIEIGRVEKQQILEFETHLAAATSKVVITEQNTLLLSQLMIMDPMGVARKLPPIVVDQLKVMNATHRLGHLLCRSRKPDLLLEIIQKHGTSQSMPWLADLVQNSDGDFSHLPVQCLCEFLLSHSNNLDKDNARDFELINYLQNLLKDPREDNQTAIEVIEYFLQRLSSQSKQGRMFSINGLNILMRIFRTADDGEEQTSDWLLLHMPRIPQFPLFRGTVIAQLRAACQIENDQELISSYIQFITAHTQSDSVPEMIEHVMDMAQLIVERSQVFTKMIPMEGRNVEEVEVDESKLQTLNCLFMMFNGYFLKLRDFQQPFTWNEYSDLLLVRFCDHSELPIHLNIVHGFVILMTYSHLLRNAQQIVHFWFPQATPNGHIILPQAFNYETMEQVNIFPDWLKLKMIRSPVERLVEASIQELTSNQIVLFLQSFGTPILSISKLLALMDVAVIEDYESVKEAILHKTYLVELIEIQHQRGAKNGHIALQALVSDSGEKRMDEEEVAVEEENVVMKVVVGQKKKLQKEKEEEFTEGKIVAVLKEMFQNRPVEREIRKLLCYLVTKESKEHWTVFVNVFLHPQWYNLNTLLRSGVNESTALLTVVRFLMQLGVDLLPMESKLRVIENLEKSLGKCPNILASLLKHKTQLKARGNEKESQRVVRKLSTRNYDEFALYLQTAPLNEVEVKGRRMMNELMDLQRQQIGGSRGDGEIVKAIITALNSHVTESTVIKEEEPMEMEVDSETEKPPIRISSMDFKKGMLVDWLADVDPELVSNFHTSQMDLLFSSTDHQFRYYLLSLLIHRTNWQTLKFTVDELLQKFTANYDPTSVLDFIESILKNPRLWQGRDKTIPTSKYKEVLLTDRLEDYFTMSRYIMQEHQMTMSDSNGKRFSKRIDLLVDCMGKNYETFVKQLLKMIIKAEEKEVDPGLKCAFLRHLYNKLPFIKWELLACGYDLEAAGAMKSGALTELQDCALDKSAHYLLTALICCSSVKDWQMLSHDVEMLLIKLASTHPHLFLRHLTAIPALMQGRLSGDFASVASLNCFRNDFQLQLFGTVLNVLDVLKPRIFHPRHVKALDETLVAYLNLFYMKDSRVMIGRFVDFLKEYYRTNPEDCNRFLRANYNNMFDFARRFNIQPMLQFLQNFSYIEADEEGGTDKEKEQPETEGDVELLVVVKEEKEKEKESVENKLNRQLIVKDPSALATLTPLSNAINQDFRLMNALKDTTEDEKIYQLLEEWEGALQRQPLFGESSVYFEKICQLLNSYSERNRIMAHNMLLRLLQVNCGNKAFVQHTFMVYSRCLESTDGAVIDSTLEVLNEAIAYLQEFAGDLLKMVFHLGVSSQTNTFTCMKKCFAVLNLQRAC